MSRTRYFYTGGGTAQGPRSCRSLNAGWARMTGDALLPLAAVMCLVGGVLGKRFSERALPPPMTASLRSTALIATRKGGTPLLEDICHKVDCLAVNP